VLTPESSILSVASEARSRDGSVSLIVARCERALKRTLLLKGPGKASYVSYEKCRTARTARLAVETVGFSARKRSLSRSRSATLPRRPRATHESANGRGTKYARGRDVTEGSTRTQYPPRDPITQALVTMHF